MNIRTLAAFSLVVFAALALAACSGSPDLSVLQTEIPNYNSSSVLKVSPKKLQKQYKKLNDLNYGPLRNLDMALSTMPKDASNEEITKRQQTLDKVNAKRSAVQEQMKIIQNGLAEQPIMMFNFGMAAARMDYLPCHMTFQVGDPASKKWAAEKNRTCNWKEQGQTFRMIGRKLIEMGDLPLAANVDFRVKKNIDPYSTKLGIKKVGKDFVQLVLKQEQWKGDMYYPWKGTDPGYVDW